MSSLPPPERLARLENERNIWFATVRPDGRPHLVPLWFAWHEGLIYVCMQPDSVKAANLRHNNRVALSLEDGDRPLIVEGFAEVVDPPWSEGVAAVFQRKYDWNIFSDGEYTQLVAVRPQRWLHWG